MGNVALKLLAGLVEGRTMDRVLNGPTNKVWIEPWLHHLDDLARDRGVDFRLVDRTEVIGIQLSGKGDIEYVVLAPVTWGAGGRGQPSGDPSQWRKLRGDIFVSALAVEDLALVIRRDADVMAAGNRQFETGGQVFEMQFDNIVELARPKGDHLQWMSGLQIYLRQDERYNEGHQLYLDSPWGLTSISQAQFWEKRYLPERVGGVLSIDISSWELKGLNGRPAAWQCARRDIYAEVRDQIRVALGAGALDKSNVIGWHLDESIVGPNFSGQRGETVRQVNLEPILVNHVNSWELRPTAKTAIRNLFVAGDFARTATDLACMEGANEAARLAVNELLLTFYPDEKPCRLFQTEPASLRLLQMKDSVRYERGLPWSGTDLGKWAIAGAETATVLGDETFRLLSGIDETTGTEEGHILPMHGSAELAANEASVQSGDGVVAAFPYRLPREEWDGLIKKEAKVRALTQAQIEDARGNDYATPGRADPMFKRWRLHELQHQRKNYLVPFHAYQADALVIHGKVKNYPLLEELTAGTPYRPAYAMIKSDRVGFGELWIIKYQDTIAGPYSEVVINFVVRKNERRRYHWRSPFSSIVPMMDSANRLFTIQLLLQEKSDRPYGPIEYGRELFGFDKRRAEIVIRRENGVRTFECGQDNVLSVWGRVDETDRLFQTISDTTELARELGARQLAKDLRQAREGAELSGGLVTKDFRKNDGTGPETVDVRAAYKFAPRLSQLEPRSREVLDWDPGTEFGRILTNLQFEHTIATRDPRLKSVLYIDEWPDPND
jgi:hypothetical protein